MEQLAQFVTKSFEFNNCFSAKLLEAKQKTSSRDAIAAAATEAEAFLSFGLSANSSSSCASNASSSGSGNNSLMMDIGAGDEGEDLHQNHEDGREEMKNCGMNGQCLSDGNCENNGDEEDEDEIDIETDSMSDLEDNKRLIIKTNESGNAKQRVVEQQKQRHSAESKDRLRVIRPTDLRVQEVSRSRMETDSPTRSASKRDQVLDRDKKKLDANNNNDTVIRPPIIATKNWLIPDSPSKSSVILDGMQFGILRLRC